MKTCAYVSAIVMLAVSAAAVGARADEKLDSMTSINAFIRDSTPRGVSFKLTGKVVCVHSGPRATEVILTDETGERAEFFISDKSLIPPTAGDTIEAVGLARLDENLEPYMRLDEFELIKTGKLPEPVEVRLADTDAETHHLATIRTEGSVIDTFPDEIDRRYDILLLKDQNVVIPVSLPREIFGDTRNLVDARIRVTGVYHRYVGGVRKFAWPNILLHEAQDLEVLTQPPEDPFSVPPLESRLYLTSDEIAKMSKRSITGKVLATWSDDQVMVREPEGHTVNLTLANGITLPRYGEDITAAGLPETDLFRLNLTSARWKPAAAPIPSRTNETAMSLSDITFTDDNGQISIQGEAYGKLLSVCGIIRTLPTPADGNRFVLDTERREIIVDASSIPTDALAIGSKVQVTGRSILLTDGEKRVYGSSKVKGLALIIRTSSDVVVLTRPPWWTPAKFCILISVLLMVLIGFAIWNLIQRHFARTKIAERTRLAVELHDTLSQNLAGVACQVDAGNFALAENPDAARPFFNAAEQMLQSCRTELKNCLFDLRSDMLEESDFNKAILKALNQLTFETAVSVRFPVRRADFSDQVVHAILSVIRELTGNAVRHGHATAVRISGCTDKGKLLFSVTDNGSGFDPRHCDGIPEGHYGLSGIRDRLKRLNGTFCIDSTPGKGTKATVTLPITT